MVRDRNLSITGNRKANKCFSDTGMKRRYGKHAIGT